MCVETEGEGEGKWAARSAVTLPGRLACRQAESRPLALPDALYWRSKGALHALWPTQP